MTETPEERRARLDAEYEQCTDPFLYTHCPKCDEYYGQPADMPRRKIECRDFDETTEDFTCTKCGTVCTQDIECNNIDEETP